MDIADCIVHVRQALTINEQRMLEGRLRKLAGVIASRFNPPVTHLLLVAYKPVELTPISLLQQVKAAGYDASLVGM